MKQCTVEGCTNKHHGKGYCKAHYKEFVLSEFYKTKTCDVPGCHREVSTSTNGKYYCSMHYTRFRRNEPIGGLHSKRSREFFSLTDQLMKSDNPLEYVLPSRESWSIYSKLVYGNKCMECGWDQGECDAHHRVPFSKGGKHTISNAYILCPNCHRLKHSRKRRRFSEESIALFNGLLDGRPSDLKKADESPR
jgi:5-methylcytosine-specific restriction endonuclease McrA